MRGALKLAGAIVLVDHVLMAALFGLMSLSLGSGIADWLGGIALVGGYRLASLHPLILLALLRVFRQELRDFSLGLTTLLSLTSSTASVYVVGLILAALGGEPIGALPGAAGEMFVSFLFTEPLPRNPLALMLIAFLLSPWLVRSLRGAWLRAGGRSVP